MSEEARAYLTNRDTCDEDPDIRQARLAKAVADGRRDVIDAAGGYVDAWEDERQANLGPASTRLFATVHALRKAMREAAR